MTYYEQYLSFGYSEEDSHKLAEFTKEILASYGGAVDITEAVESIVSAYNNYKVDSFYNYLIDKAFKE